MSFRSLPSTVLAVGLAGQLLTAPAYASGEADADAAPAIVVTGQRDSYATRDTSSATKTNTPLLDIPQAVSVVTAAQIDDQQIRSIIDLVRIVPGAIGGQGEGNRDQITLRGNNSSANFFVDGLRDDVQYFRSFYNIDLVEVHKGANAMIFGRGGGGGVINRVTKTANLERSFGEVTLSADSFGSYYGAADVNLTLGSAALRLNGTYEELNTHRDAFGGHRYAFNPTLGAQLGATRLDLSYEHVRDSRVADRGIPSAFIGTIAAPSGPLTGYRDTFFGVRGVNDTQFEAHVGSFRSNTQFGETLSLTTQAIYGDYNKRYTNVYASTAIGGTATAPTVGINAYDDPSSRTSFIGQANLIWKAKTGAIDHVILFGGEYTAQNSQNERINGFFSPTVLTAANRNAVVTLRDPIVIPQIYFRAGVSGNGNRSVSGKLKQFSVYLQDQISFGEKVDLIAGVRYDRLDNVITNLFDGAKVARVDALWSPRVGLVYKPIPTASIYASYSKSFLPQSGDQFSTFDATFAALEPETFENYEFGAKWDIRPGLAASAALYRLNRGNTRAANPIAGGPSVLTGSQVSRGFEFSLSGRLTEKWQATVSYANTQAEITTTTTAAPAGRQIGQVPQHQLSLWNRYDFSKQIGLGLGLYHQSSLFASISNTVVIPSYTRLDAALFLDLGRGIKAQVNVENLANVAYFPVAQNDVNISTGGPRNIRFTLKAAF
jgi:catecholate siderophore receptor